MSTAQMLVGVTPPVGSKGVFTLTSHYDTTLVANTVYTCIAVRLISDMIKDNVDVFGLYYAAKSIPIEQYQYDIVNGGGIVSLSDASGNIVKVPTSYIASYPAAGGVPVSVLGFAVTVTALPEDTDLNYVRSLIVDAIKDGLGVVITADQVKPAKLSQTQMISQADAAKIRSTCALNIKLNPTWQSRYNDAFNQLQATLAKNVQLEKYIKSKATTPPPVV